MNSILKLENERIASIANKSAKLKRQRITLQVFKQQAIARLGCYLNSPKRNDFELLHFLFDSVSNKASFALQLSGDNMKPKYRDKDIVYIEFSPYIEPGQIGLFLYQGEVHCKQLRNIVRKRFI